MATLTPPKWANLEFLVISSTPQFVADPDNPGELIMQPGWVEITTTEQLADVEQQIAGLTPVPPPPPNFVGFRDDIESILTEPFLNELGSLNSALMLSLRDGFVFQDLGNIVKYWNRAIASHSTELIAILEQDHAGQSKADFARAKAAEHNIPVTLTPAYLLEPIQAV